VGTALVKSCQNGANIKKLTDQQAMFVLEYLADPGFSASNAARKAGYKHPAQAAGKLLKNTRILKILGKEKRLREERCKLTGDNVLQCLKTALFFNPLDYFYPSENGGWNITDISALPTEVGQLIESMKIKVTQNPDGSTSSIFEVQLVSKSTALSLAMKHTMVERHEVKQVIDWSPLYKEPTEENSIDKALREAEEDD